MISRPHHPMNSIPHPEIGYNKNENRPRVRWGIITSSGGALIHRLIHALNYPNFHFVFEVFTTRTRERLCTSPTPRTPMATCFAQLCSFHHSMADNQSQKIKCGEKTLTWSRIQQNRGGGSLARVTVSTPLHKNAPKVNFLP